MKNVLYGKYFMQKIILLALSVMLTGCSLYDCKPSIISTAHDAKDILNIENLQPTINCKF